MGASRAATTSLRYDLINAGIECAGGKYGLWGVETGLQKKYKTSELGVTLHWLKSMPRCSQTARRVVADFSQGSFSLIEHQGEVNNIPLPSIMRKLYGELYTSPVF